MLIKRNTEPKNKEFFDRVAPIAPTILIAGVFLQVISAITESFGVYQFGSAINSPFIVKVFFTIAIAAVWELVIRGAFTYVFKTGAKIWHDKIVIKKLEVALFVLLLSMGSALLYYSWFVSKENAHMTFEVMMPDRDTTALSSIDQSKNANLTALGSTYAERKTEIEKRFSEQLSASKGVYLAARAKHNTNIQDWRDKEKRYNKTYPSRIKREKDAINAAYEKHKTEASEITKLKADELAALDQWRDGRETGVIALAGDNVSEDNKKRETFKAWYSKFAIIWAHFAGWAGVLGVACIAFGAVFKVLAGIDEETHLTPESLDPGLWTEFMYLVHLKVKSPIRNKIRTAINKTASKRVDLEIVTPSTISVTPERYAPPSVTGSSRTVTHPLRSASVTPAKSVTESVTEMRYGKEPEKPLSPLPTHVTGVTGPTVTDSKGSALRKPEPVTKTEAVTIELEPTVTGTKPKKEEKTVTDSPGQIIMVSPTKAVIINPQNGKRETISYNKVGSRKRGNYGNVKNRKSKAAKARCKEMGDFYADLEKQMKEAK
jgi:hypothetical protein